MIVPIVDAKDLLANPSLMKLAVPGCTLIVKASHAEAVQLVKHENIINNIMKVWIDLQGDVDAKSAVALLDGGVEKLISDSLDVPLDRIVVNGSKEGFPIVIAPESQAKLSQSKHQRVLVSMNKPTLQQVKEYQAANIDIIVPASNLIAESLGVSSDKINIGEAYATCLVSDRPDGLFATVVVDEHGVCLGLVYSSIASICESIKLGQGVYHSRHRGLWQKGLTSGATQTLLKIDTDCDRDALRYTVHQHGKGFCHLDTRTCFGPDGGISELSEKLIRRHASAPPGSYTARLFSDQALLHSKIMEEAGELCTAKSKDEVAWEAADLIYFALTKCVAEGVNLVDVEKHLDARGKKVTRRPGDAKPGTIVPTAQINGSANDAKIEPPKESRQRKDQEQFNLAKYHLSDIDAKKRAALLQRPVLDTASIMDRVKPIVEAVRTRGDAAIKEFTTKFDGVKMDSVVMLPPYEVHLEEDVKEAIDTAYDNIFKFHEAQMDKSTLVVETMPVRCAIKIS
jgi:phosphoribosyl-ATP pyrophosphohydrolase/phosphoribosyl-AMP cyclohydrolase/histidinol dehydrogenase